MAPGGTEWPGGLCDYRETSHAPGGLFAAQSTKIIFDFWRLERLELAASRAGAQRNHELGHELKLAQTVHFALIKLNALKI